MPAGCSTVAGGVDSATVALTARGGPLTTVPPEGRGFFERNAMTAKHTPTPWPEPIRNNDVGTGDEGYWEYWEIPGVARFNSEDDARLAHSRVNAHEQLVAACIEAEDALTKEIEASDLYDDATHTMYDVRELLRAALAAADVHAKGTK